MLTAMQRLAVLLRCRWASPAGMLLRYEVQPSVLRCWGADTPAPAPGSFTSCTGARGSTVPCRMFPHRHNNSSATDSAACA